MSRDPSCVITIFEASLIEREQRDLTWYHLYVEAMAHRFRDAFIPEDEVQGETTPDATVKESQTDTNPKAYHVGVSATISPDQYAQLASGDLPLDESGNPICDKQVLGVYSHLTSPSLRNLRALPESMDHPIANVLTESMYDPECKVVFGLDGILIYPLYPKLDKTAMIRISPGEFREYVDKEVICEQILPYPFKPSALLEYVFEYIAVFNRATSITPENITESRA